MLFVYVKPDGEGSAPSSRTAVARAAHKHIKGGQGPYVGVLDGGKVVFSRKTRATLFLALRHELGLLKVGETLRVRAKGKVVFWVRGVEPAIRLIDINGNHNADLYWSWIVATYGQYHPSNGGAYVCKDVWGTNSPSQHSYGNAVDVFFDTSAHQVEVYNAVKRGAAPVPIAHAISHTSIWSPSEGEHYYSGEFHSHLHVDFLPQYSGGCGVRG